ADSRLQKSDRSGQHPPAAIRFRVGIGPESTCHPYFDIRCNRYAWIAESGRENADNGVGIIVELQLSPQNSGISAEPSGPQTIADHDRFSETLRLVTRAKHPPDVRGNAKHGEIVRTHPSSSRCCGRSPPVKFVGPPWVAVTCSKTPALDLRSSLSGTESPISCAPTPRLLATIFTNRSGCEKGSERNKTAFTMLKIAVFAPTPKARESTATMVKPGLFQSTRSPYARPEIMWSSKSLPAGSYARDATESNQLRLAPIKPWPGRQNRPYASTLLISN